MFMLRGAVAVLALVTSALPIQALGRAAPVAPSAASTRVAERYHELPPLLLPETLGATLPDRADGTDPGGEVVLAFVVDTLGRIELSTVETLAATDSSTARALRRGLAAVRYVPARLVLDGGTCLRVNGVRMHCGGLSPALKRLRARVVLRLEASPNRFN